MATSHIFSDPAVNLHISPFSIYLLIEGDNNVKDREAITSVGRRKTVTGNLFKLRVVRKDLVVRGKDRKALKEALGNANIIAEVLNPATSVPEYLHTRIEYNPDNLEKTADEVREFIKDLCDRDINALRKKINDYSSAPEQDFLRQLESLRDYLQKEIEKNDSKLDYRRSHKIDKLKKHRISNFYNGLPDDIQGFRPLGLIAKEFSHPEEYGYERTPKKEKNSFSAEEIKRAFEALGWNDGYEKFLIQIHRNRPDPIYNIRNLVLRFKKGRGRERVPHLELEISNKEKIDIEIGTKPGCLFYGAMLLSLMERKKFPRAAFLNIITEVKKRCKEKGSVLFTAEDYASIPQLIGYEKLYKTLFGNGSGSFVQWCKEEYTASGLNNAMSRIKRNIEETMKSVGLQDFSSLLLINKKWVYEKKGRNQVKSQVYWIEFPIDQIDFPSDPIELAS